jgi:hypothetical protein
VREHSVHELVFQEGPIALNRPLRAADYVRLGVLAAAILWLSWRAWVDGAALLRVQPLGIDFMPMWAAAGQVFSHPERVYDFFALTEVQRPLLAGFHGLRPFVYPPSALFVFAPFALAPFGLANGLWTAAGLALLVWVMARRLTALRTPLLIAMAVSPASALVMLTGQTTFVIAALVVGGLFALKDRPILAGVLFGLAGAIKPPALVLLPVALIAARQWRALASAAASAAVVALASMALFGPQLWLQWLAAMPRFETLVMTTPPLWRGMITPTGLGLWFGFTPDQLGPWRIAFAVGGAAIAWHVFRTTEDSPRRLTALLGGALFVSPYAMHYDAALIAPAAALMLSQRLAPGAWFAALCASALVCCAAIPHWGAAGVTAFVLLVSLVSEKAFTGKLRLPSFATPARQEAAG